MTKGVLVMRGVRSSGRRARPVGWRRLLAVAVGLAMCMALLPVFTSAAAPADLKTFLESPAARQGDGVHRLGMKLSPEGAYPIAPTAAALKAGIPIAAANDLSSQLPPIGDQGNQGSCIAWAASYYYKTWSEKQEHTSWDITNSRYEFSPSFVYNQINGGADNGSNFDDAFALLQNKGDVDIFEFPYNQNNCTAQPSAAQFQEAKPYRIPSGWSYFWQRNVYGPYSPGNDITNAKATLASGKLIVMAIPIYNDWPDYGSNPAKTYYDYNGSSSLAGGHGVCICGYNDNANPSGADADHKGGFKMVNSWGSSWNGNGYVYLSYDFVKRYAFEAWTMSDNSPDTPAITSLSKTSGNVGDSLDINGSNFGGLRRSAKVTFNGTAATNLTWTNEKVTATVPAGATTGPVAVADWDGASSNTVTFTVGGTTSGPQITSVTPASAANTAPASFTLAGSGFKSGCTVKLARSGQSDIAASSVSFVSSSRVDCTANITGASASAWDVTLTNPDAAVATLSGGFTITSDTPTPSGDTYEPNDSIAQAYGPLAAGTSYASYIWTQEDADYYTVDVADGAGELSVALTTVPGGCDYDLYVYDSAEELAGYSDNSSNTDEQVTVASPEAGSYYVAVLPYDGCSQDEAYHLSADSEGGSGAAPVISGISPASATPRSAVTISGSGFGDSRGSSCVSFGSAQPGGYDYVSWSDTRVVCRVPMSAGGRLNVSVTTDVGTSKPVSFGVVPAISTLKPTSGRGGTVVTINGQGFGTWVSGQCLVMFGSTRSVRYLSWNNGTLKVLVPKVWPGRVALTVRTAGGTSAAKTFTVLR
jgi:hypothetical protein